MALFPQGGVPPLHLCDTSSIRLTHSCGNKCLARLPRFAAIRPSNPKSLVSKKQIAGFQKNQAFHSSPPKQISSRYPRQHHALPAPSRNPPPKALAEPAPHHPESQPVVLPCGFSSKSRSLCVFLSPRATPEPIWAETPKLSAVGEQDKNNNHVTRRLHALPKTAEAPGPGC